LVGGVVAGKPHGGLTNSQIKYPALPHEHLSAARSIFTSTSRAKTIPVAIAHLGQQRARLGWWRALPVVAR
jgi:hypothetical protein